MTHRRISGKATPWIHPAFLAAALLVSAGCGVEGRGGGISASGTIEAVKVTISSKVSGEIAVFHVEEGSAVEKGDLLADVDHASLDIQLRQAEAGVALADAQLDLLRKGARAEDIRQAEDSVKQAEAALGIAEDDAARMRALAGKGSVTPKQKDDAEARLTAARAQAATAGEGLKKIRRLARPEEIKAAEARLAQAAAAADLLRKTISDCRLRAPADGVVTNKAVEAGEFVVAGAAVLTVSALSPVYLMIYVPEKDVGRISLGQAAEVRIDSFPGRVFPGKVTYISSEAEFTPKNVQTKEDRIKLVFGVKIELANDGGALKPGLPADAALHPGARESR
ncbi:MAG TPA: efflux RND transporter periplasmic adaptor subunit [Candidatus Aminicenantes bacterium]|nr:efflux RND transporter periplasmic adaptor subunit [Candidatus Aminicenantes bacterium]